MISHIVLRLSVDYILDPCIFQLIQDIAGSPVSPDKPLPYCCLTGPKASDLAFFNSMEPHLAIVCSTNMESHGSYYKTPANHDNSRAGDKTALRYAMMMIE